MQVSIKQIINAALVGDDLRIIERALSAAMGERYADPTATLEDIDKAAVLLNLEEQMAEAENPAFLSDELPTPEEVFADQKKVNLATMRMQSVFATLSR